MKLYGANGSEWKRVRHIAREGEERGILKFEHEGGSYRNENGKTWKMVKAGRKGNSNPDHWGDRLSNWLSREGEYSDWESNGQWRR